jgi:hypothetical protein
LLAAALFLNQDNRRITASHAIFFMEILPVRPSPARSAAQVIFNL